MLLNFFFIFDVIAEEFHIFEFNKGLALLSEVVVEDCGDPLDQLSLVHLHEGRVSLETYDVFVLCFRCSNLLFKLSLKFFSYLVTVCNGFLQNA